MDIAYLKIISRRYPGWTRKNIIRVSRYPDEELIAYFNITNSERYHYFNLLDHLLESGLNQNNLNGKTQKQKTLGSPIRLKCGQGQNNQLSVERSPR